MTDFEKLSGIDRREAIKRVSVLLGGVAFVGGSSLMTACAGDRPPAADTTKAAVAPAPIGEFSVADQQFLDAQCLKIRLDPGHVARPTLFLAADDSDGMTGQHVLVDAGIAQQSVIT